MIYSYHSKLGHSLEPTIATSASSYLTDDGRRGDIERIPTGLVKQNRMLFAGNRQSSIAPQESPSTKLSLSRRTSEPFVNDAEPPMPRGMPTSSYLLRKSQENLLTRKAEDETTQDQTYRTIIMFNDRSRSRKVTFNAKVHNSPRSRSVGVTEHWALARPALSIPAESSATTPIPRSSEFLDLITQKPGGFPLSPNTIRRNCKQMMDFVKTRGCQLSPEEGYESQGADKDSATNEMISMSDALSNSQLLLTELQKPKNSYNDEGSQGSSSPSESIISNVEIAKLKDDEIKRLEVELGNAQECNQQLMAQMGALAKKDAVELKHIMTEVTLLSLTCSSTR
ncbi:hypothetical protein L596_011493 [Steinernema carpocapsae]|uniref:Uncharacterized protein n=1 Tax=Steinernema carpocapsae TaxID=34508 RepID=A0A4U5NUZ4_STECR|nr:hypothetical protein L596_011493 [Steinernema carpocapsae]